MELFVIRDESGLFKKAKIEISDQGDLTTLKAAIVEYIEWMESLNFQYGDSEEREMYRRAVKVKNDLDNVLD